MKTLLLLAALALPLAAQDAFDFKTLDKLGTNTKNTTSVTLDADTLKMAAGFLSGKDNADFKTLVDGLKGIYIRTWEFPRKGLYNEADLAPFRAWLKQSKWNRIVESRQDNQLSEVYLLPQTGGKLGGVAIVSAEEKQVTVVYINGTLNPEDIAKLSGNMGIPSLENLKLPEKPKKEED